MQISDTLTYTWTNHSKHKIRYYRLSESLIKRVIRFPKRTEEGIVENTICAMRPAQSKKYHEIWTMYKIVERRIKVITAWRYPGKSPKRNPIPQEILDEIYSIL